MLVLKEGWVEVIWDVEYLRRVRGGNCFEILLVSEEKRKLNWDIALLGMRREGCIERLVVLWGGEEANLIYCLSWDEGRRLIWDIGDLTVTVKCRIVMKSLFLYLNLCLSVVLNSLSCSFTSIYFFSINKQLLHIITLYILLLNHCWKWR